MSKFKNDFKNPRIEMHYALDSDLNLHCFAIKDAVLNVINEFEDKVIMNISIFNKLQKMLEEIE